jgi:hypothetical protein
MARLPRKSAQVEVESHGIRPAFDDVVYVARQDIMHELVRWLQSHLALIQAAFQVAQVKIAHERASQPGLAENPHQGAGLA